MSKFEFKIIKKDYKYYNFFTVLDNGNVWTWRQDVPSLTYQVLSRLDSVIIDEFKKDWQTFLGLTSDNNLR